MSVLLLLSSCCRGIVAVGARPTAPAPVACPVGDEGAALPVMRMFLKASTSRAGLPAPCLSAVASSCDVFSPLCPSTVASVLAKGLYGNFIPPSAVAVGAFKGGSAPEFRLVLLLASLNSSSPVVESESVSSSLSSNLAAGCGGGGGDSARVAESEAERRRRSLSAGLYANSGELGDTIVTRFFFVRVGFGGGGGVVGAVWAVVSILTAGAAGTAEGGASGSFERLNGLPDML